jgi:gliding motility-associated-like protein
VDKNNCQKRLAFDIAEVNCGSNDVVVHDVITPNGDGINDVWTIEGLQKYPGNSVQVFDKVGNQVYQKSNYDNSWGGQASNGDQLPDGTYYYLVQLNAPSTTGGSNIFSGAILIKR